MLLKKSACRFNIDYKDRFLIEYLKFNLLPLYSVNEYYLRKLGANCLRWELTDSRNIFMAYINSSR